MHVSPAIKSNSCIASSSSSPQPEVSVPTNDLSSLPKDVLEKIARYLPPDATAHLRKTCQKLRNFVYNPSVDTICAAYGEKQISDALSNALKNFYKGFSVSSIAKTLSAPNQSSEFLTVIQKFSAIQKYNAIQNFMQHVDSLALGPLKNNAVELRKTINDQVSPSLNDIKAALEQDLPANTSGDEQPSIRASFTLEFNIIKYNQHLKAVIASLNNTADIETVRTMAREILTNGLSVANRRWLGSSSTEPATLALLAKDADPQVRRCVALHDKTSPETLAFLAYDADVGVRIRVAKNNHTSSETLALLANDVSGQVRCAVVQHKYTSPATLALLANDANVEVRKQARLKLKSWMNRPALQSRTNR